MIGEWNERASRELIEQLIQQGVTYFCLAPGFRSTPLVLALAEHPSAEVFVHFDERGLGFHALGYAKATRKAAALIVTSGTAVGNLYPAVMEASSCNLPLLILTADRPADLREVGANQTCDQVKFFGNYVRFSFDLPAPSEFLPDRFLATTVAHALFCAKDGPVHLNCAFPEPFWKNRNVPFIPESPCIYDCTNSSISLPILEKWKNLLDRAEKGLIVVGELHSTQPHTPLLELAEKLQWPILGDILSGLRTLGTQAATIRYWEEILQNEAALSADVILHIGGRYVSKKLLECMKAPVLHISSHVQRCDPKHQVTNRLICDPLQFCEQILPHLDQRTHNWLSQWKNWEKEVETALWTFFSEESPLTEPGLFRMLPDSFPALFIGNSMPIRDANRFFFPKGITGPIFANRGLSGIDGNIATCTGIAATTPLIAIMGDQTALHDLNSLALLPKCTYPLTLVILNNGGGGIFSLLALPQKEHIIETCFAGAHAYTFEKAAALFDIPYACVQQTSQILPFLGKTALIEVITNRKENAALHRAIETCLSSYTVS